MKHIDVIMGGPSAEHEISLRTGREVLLHIDRSKYVTRAVLITQESLWFFAKNENYIPEISELSHPQGSPNFSGPFTLAQCTDVWSGCDVAFLALHGSFGEDGVIQGYLEAVHLPYTGSGVFASAVAMNKIATKFMFEQTGITTPPFSIWGRNHPATTIDAIISKHDFPCFVKCPQSGSSRLMGRAGNRKELESLLNEFKHEADEILIETAISGTEFSCPVLELSNGSLKALPVIEIRPKAEFFDFTAKYTDGGSEEIVPAPHPAQLTEKIQQISIHAHQLLGCSGLTRTDVILANEKLYVLEINTLPGFTSNSLAPKAFICQGGTYAELLDILIATARLKKR